MGIASIAPRFTARASLSLIRQTISTHLSTVGDEGQLALSTVGDEGQGTVGELLFIIKHNVSFMFYSC